MKKLYYIFGSLLGVIIFIWIILFAVPVQKEKSHLDKEIKVAEAQLDDYNRILHEFNETFKNYEKLIEQKNHLISKLFTKDDLLKLLDHLKELGYKNNIEIVEMSPSVEELIKLNKSFPQDGRPIELDILIKMRASLKNAGLFIKTVESEDYYKGFNRCQIINQSIGDERAFYTYGFKAILGTLKEG